MNEPTKRALVERAIAAAERARPVLEQRASALSAVTDAAGRAHAAARAWLDKGDGVLLAADEAAATAKKAIAAAWLDWDRSPNLAKDLVAIKRALHAAEAAALAATCAAWTPERAVHGHSAGEAELRAAAGPVDEVVEAEHCASMAFGGT